MIKKMHSQSLDCLVNSFIERFLFSLEQFNSSSKKKLTIGLVGGSSVASFLRPLQNISNVPWEKLHFFLIDERKVEPNHQDSNHFLLNQVFFSSLINKKLITSDQIHPYFPKKSAHEYFDELKKISDKFDIALLSSGEDGHIASLFPNRLQMLDKTIDYLEVTDSPKPPRQRITASPNLIQASQCCFLFFIGKSKKNSLNQFFDEKLSAFECPAKILSTHSNSYLFTDLDLGEKNG